MVFTVGSALMYRKKELFTDVKCNLHFPRTLRKGDAS
jgi:hypothetical protein